MVKYKRILLKLSGEALANNQSTLDANTLRKIVNIIKSVLALDVEVGIVIGGGNLFRGEALTQVGINRITSDHMGMLATVINALALRDTFQKNNINCVMMSGFAIGGGVCDSFDHQKAKQLLSNKTVVIFSAGTGNPCFTTDTGAVLRGIEIDADIIFKATKVDGIYSEDPIKNQNATRYTTLSFDQAIENNLKIMDTAAFTLCRKHDLKICVFSLLENTQTLADILIGKPLGTIVEG